MSDLARSDPLSLSVNRTPSRIFAGRAGAGYLTSTLLKLRADHAAARDAVHDEVDWTALFGSDFPVFGTLASTKNNYLMRPDRGRLFDEKSRTTLAQSKKKPDLQIVVGDGLSAAAVRVQAPAMMSGITKEASARGWSLGIPFGVRYCRVGILNDIGELLQPQVVVLLIGERPGLATAESLSAYLAFQPRTGHTDAHRNLISNIHTRGVSIEEAAARIVNLAADMMALKSSGVNVKEGETRLPPNTVQE